MYFSIDQSLLPKLVSGVGFPKIENAKTDVISAVQADIVDVKLAGQRRR
jgi:hypothetical protein